MIKEISMAQRVNHLQNSIFVNPPPLPLSCGPTPSLEQAGRQADNLPVSFEIFKLSYGLKYSSFCFV